MKTNFIKNTTNKHYSFRYSIDGKEKKIDFPPFQTVRVIDFAEVKETESYKTLTFGVDAKCIVLFQAEIVFYCNH